METKNRINNKTDALDRQQCACASLRKATRKITGSYDAQLKPVGLNSTQFTVLSAVELMGKSRQSDIASALAMDGTTLTRNLKPLAEKGWILIERGDDQRVRMVSLSNKGKNILKKAIPLWQQAQLSFVEKLGAQNWQRLRDSLHALQKL